MKLAVASSQACIAVPCFAIGAICLALGRGIETGRGGVGLFFSVTGGWQSSNGTQPNGTTTQWFDKRFSDDSVHARWQRRHDASRLDLLGHFATGVGWVSAIPAVSSLAHVLGGSERSASHTVKYCFIAAAILTCTEFLSDSGTMQTANWLTQWNLLQDESANDEGELTAAAAFELTYLMVQSRTLWLYAADDLLLAFALLSAAFLTYASKHQQVPKAHGVLGAVIALLCVLDFSFEVNRFENWRWSTNALIVTTLLVYVVLLPVWLLWLAHVLRKISRSGGAYLSTTGGEVTGNRVDPSRVDLENVQAAA